MTFVHLHTHSHYSILDGASKVDQMVKRAAELGQPAIALTDHGSLSGAHELWRAGQEYGVKPIIGIEAYLAPGSRFDKKPTYWGTPDQRRMDISGQGKYTHLTLLAENAQGLRNLYKMHELAHTEGFYGKPRIDLELLQRYAEGVLILTGCMSGVTVTMVRLGLSSPPDSLAKFFSPKKSDLDPHLGVAPELWGALSHLLSLRNIVSPRNLYVEVMSHGIERDDVDENWINSQLITLAQTLSLPIVATNDSHYTSPEDLQTQKAMLWLQTNGNFSGFDGDGYHLKGREEMQKLFPAEYLDTTLAIAERISSYDEVFEYKNRMPVSLSPKTLRQEISEALARHGVNPEYDARANYELDIIEPKGYDQYFLVLADLVAFARGAGIWVGPGRGSAGGSLIAYLLGITGLDPIEHGLLFERFLSPTRVSPPDIDIDFEPSRAHEVVEYAVSKYGAACVAELRTFGTIGARAALKDANRVLGGTYAEGQRLVGMVPPPVRGRASSLADSRGIRSENREVYDLAESIEGFIRQPSKHAAGIVISPEPLSDMIPVSKGPNDELLVTGFTNEVIEELGMVKFDLLKLETLEIIKETMRLIDE